MRLVIDTNVIVSGLITARGPCARILDLVFEGAIEPCIDDRLLAEYEPVLRRPELRIAPMDAALVLAFIRDSARHVVPSLLDVSLPDRDDIPFIEVATAAEALLVTGNVRHFPPRFRGTVTVVTPRELLELLREYR